MSLQVNYLLSKPKRHPKATHITLECLPKNPRDNSLFSRFLRLQSHLERQWASWKGQGGSDYLSGSPLAKLIN